MSGFCDSKHSLLLALMIFALAVRMLIPTGWMPSMIAGKATITLCTGAGMVEAWVDADGKIHKDSPAKKSANDQPCAFAGLSAAADASSYTELSLEPALPTQSVPVAVLTGVAIGLGLAAPPPPAIGPPTLI
jgi:hypothetical protein